MVCVIPAAGHGTRMMSVTHGHPKELLPLGSKLVLQRIIAEARTAEPDEIVIVNSPNKPEIDEAVTRWQHSEFADVPIRIAYQREPMGAAQAIACADVEDDLLILLGDCVFPEGSPISRMRTLLDRGIEGVIAVEEVPPILAKLYGMVDVNQANGSIRRIVEKPGPGESPGGWAVAARYGLTKSLSAFLSEYCGEHPGEVGLTEVINAALAERADFRAIALQPDQRRVDCGSPEEYQTALRERWD